MCEECPVTCNCCCKDLASQKHASQYVYSACVGVCVCKGGLIYVAVLTLPIYMYFVRMVVAKLKVCIYFNIYTAEVELFFLTKTFVI